MENSCYVPVIEQGWYRDGDGNIVAWYADALVVYPDFSGSNS